MVEICGAVMKVDLCSAVFVKISPALRSIPFHHATMHHYPTAPMRSITLCFNVMHLHSADIMRERACAGCEARGCSTANAAAKRTVQMMRQHPFHHRPLRIASAPALKPSLHKLPPRCTLRQFLFSSVSLGVERLVAEMRASLARPLKIPVPLIWEARHSDQ